MARLIDADALKDYVTKVYEYDLCHIDTNDYIEGRSSAEHGVLEKIRELPTIDAIPVEWLRDWQDEVGTLNEWWPIIQRIITVWQEEQEEEK